MPPWEKYAAPASAGPWQKYAAKPQPAGASAPSAVDRMTQGALAGAIPGYSTVQSVRAGLPGSDIAASAAGDISQLAMLGLAGPARLAQQTALGGAMGAAAGAIQPVSEAAGKAGRGVAESIFGTARDSPSVAVNMLRNLPGTVGETLGELGPQAALMLLGGKASKRMAEGPAPLPAGAQALLAEGGQPTAAMQATGPVSGGVLRAAELSARTNPLLEGKFRSIDEANAAAVKQAAQKQFGSDVMDPGMNVAAGRELQTSLANLADKRSADYQAALGDIGAKLGGVGDVESAIGSARGLGPGMAAAIDVASADALPSVTRLFEPLKQRLAKGDMTPRQIELELQDLRLQFENQFSNLQQAQPGSFSALDRSFKQINDAMKGAYYDGLNKVAPGIGDALREAKGDYAEMSQAMSPLSKALTFKGGMAPEAAAQQLMRSGTENLQALKDSMSPADWANTRQQIARTILDQAKDASGGISVAKLESLLNANKNVRDILPVIFDQGAELGNMRGLVEAGKTARQSQLGVVNPSGSFTGAARMGQIGAAPLSFLEPSVLAALLAKTAMDVGYTYGAPVAQRAIRGAQTAAQPVGAALQRLPRNQVIAKGALAASRSNEQPSFYNSLSR